MFTLFMVLAVSGLVAGGMHTTIRAFTPTDPRLAAWIEPVATVSAMVVFGLVFWASWYVL